MILCLNASFKPNSSKQAVHGELEQLSLLQFCICFGTYNLLGSHPSVVEAVICRANYAPCVARSSSATALTLQDGKYSRKSTYLISVYRGNDG